MVDMATLLHDGGSEKFRNDQNDSVRPDGRGNNGIEFEYDVKEIVILNEHTKPRTDAQKAEGDAGDADGLQPSRGRFVFAAEVMTIETQRVEAHGPFRTNL